MAIGSPSAKYTTPRKAAPKVENTPKRRRFSNEDKIQINQLYAQWDKRGKVDEESPIEAIVTEFGCDRTYPSRLFARAGARGSVFPKTPSGRPPVYGKERDDFIILTCVGAAGKAFMKELDWSRHLNADGYKTKGYGALFMKPFWGQMQKAAAKKLKEKGIKGKPFLDLDRAPVHNALVTRAELDRTWGEGN